MLTCVMYSILVEMSVQLFTVLNVQRVMTCLLIYSEMAFPVQVNICLGPSIVYDRFDITRSDVFSISAYHAGLNDKLRSSVLENWISCKIQVVVATVAFGYGFLYDLMLMGR